MPNPTTPTTRERIASGALIPSRSMSLRLDPDQLDLLAEDISWVAADNELRGYVDGACVLSITFDEPSDASHLADVVGEVEESVRDADFDREHVLYEPDVDGSDAWCDR